MSIKITFTDGTTSIETLMTSISDLIKRYAGHRIRVIRYL